MPAEGVHPTLRPSNACLEALMPSGGAGTLSNTSTGGQPSIDQSEEAAAAFALEEDGVQRIRYKVALLQRELDVWEKVGISTGFN